VAGVILSYWWHPFRPRLELTVAGEIFSFSSWIFVEKLATFGNTRAADFVLGRLHGAGELGVYKIGEEIGQLPGSELVAPLNRALLPGVPKLLEGGQTLGRVVIGSTGVVALVLAPTCLGIHAVAPHLVKVMLGERWLPAIPIVQLMALTSLFISLWANLHTALLAAGHARAVGLVAVGRFAVFAPCVLLLTPLFAAQGVATAALTAAVFTLLVGTFAGLRLFHLGLRDYVGQLLRPTVAAGTMWAIVATLGSALGHSTNVVIELALLVALVAVGIAVYVPMVALLYVVAGRPHGGERLIVARLDAWIGRRTVGLKGLRWWRTDRHALASEARFEEQAGTGRDAGSERVLAESVGWLCRAQDESRSADGGVARDFSLVTGWATSYPETTGYIIPTLLDYAILAKREDLDFRARRMADWLVSIQLPCGGFQGGRIDSRPIVPVTFNTGQILLGLAAAQQRFGGYGEPMRRAADWLVQTQDPDGCWRKHPTPFASAGEKAYETHVAWGLLEADRIEPARGYGAAGLANVRWALGSQKANGWIDNCCLDGATEPLTHTLGYALRGILEAYRYSGDQQFLDAARLTADGLLGAIRPDGRLAGRLLPDWSAAVDWVCLTGTVQIAHCWLLLYEFTGEIRYAEAGFAANAFVRRTVRVDGAPETRGAVKGSLPVDGAYGRFQYLNWAPKFLADSLMLELRIRSRI
jgi:hypothetical protein